jgi:hypothetical protein
VENTEGCGGDNSNPLLQSIDVTIGLVVGKNNRVYMLAENGELRVVYSDDPQLNSFRVSDPSRKMKKLISNDKTKCGAYCLYTPTAMAMDPSLSNIYIAVLSGKGRVPLSTVQYVYDAYSFPFMYFFF